MTERPVTWRQAALGKADVAARAAGGACARLGGGLQAGTIAPGNLTRQLVLPPAPPPRPMPCCPAHGLPLRSLGPVHVGMKQTGLCEWPPGRG